MRPELVAKIKDKELIKEIFGKLGYKDGGRFFDGLEGEQDPALLQAQQTIQQLQGIIDSKKVEEDSKNQSAFQLAQFKAQAERDRDILKIEGEIRKIQEQGRIDQSKLAGSAASDAELQRDAKIADLNREILKIREAAAVKIQEEQAIASVQANAEIEGNLRANQQRLENDNAMRQSQALPEVRVAELANQLAAIADALEQLTVSHVQQARQTPEITRSVQEMAAYQKAPKSIIRDDNGKPIGVAVEGYGVQPIKRDEKGEIIGVGNNG